MEQDIGLIGFGEAGRTFAVSGGWMSHAHVHDVKAQDAHHRVAKLAEFAAAGVDGCEDLAQVTGQSAIILSLVTADQALLAAESAAASMAPGTLYCDMNSVAPQTKQAAARCVEAAGSHYVDVAVMAPVDPAGLGVSLLLSGEKADAAALRLSSLGFTNVRVVGASIGRASSIKMIRSVIVKGMEALTAECILAADAAGVRNEVLASLDASEKPQNWTARADYNLGRMMVHGIRRAAEMEEVVRTLDGLGTGSAMTQGTVQRQQAIGVLGLVHPADGLENKIDQIKDERGRAA